MCLNCISFLKYPDRVTLSPKLKYQYKKLEWVQIVFDAYSRCPKLMLSQCFMYTRLEWVNYLTIYAALVSEIANRCSCSQSVIFKYQ